MNSTYMYAFIKQVAVLFPTFILLFTVRGFFQALAAHCVGDDTPEENGFLSLNPLAHIDIVGTLMLSAIFAVLYKIESSGGGFLGMALILLSIFIGVRPYYPVLYDARNFRWHKPGIVITTLATTLSYLVLALLAMYAWVWGQYFLSNAPGAAQVVRQISDSLIEWSTIWAVISLIPVPPFDAGALLPVIFGETGQEMYDALEQYALFIFIGLFFIPGLKDIFLQGIGFVHFYLYQGLAYLVVLP